MILKDLVEQLKLGELANASIGLGSDLTDEDNTYDTIIPHLNMALVSLHTKLHLKENTTSIILDSNITTYHLKTKYAQSNINSTESTKYIADTTAPYKDDCINITTITGSDGEEKTLNDLSAVNPIWLSTPNTFKVKAPVTGEVLSISYRAMHEVIYLDGLDPATTEIDIPYFTIEALCYFIASRVYSAAPSLTDGVNQGVFYMDKYNIAIKELSDSGVTTVTTQEHDKAGAKGWV